ncbi:hypothetical protein N7539_003826 [Penicillium diatomitis]|uniref:Uncharacterized protein n=1 Tax=Penicillium diatomitis TaxID=2819901 RepID=A0A9X0BXM1_9EURO|nr:uncharacterized protein N7539_003826 [Penicillium diatomitis]KAJ5488936.1 hypothetical protein N7539_003826 [Penicillium diatomitis]
MLVIRTEQHGRLVEAKFNKSGVFKVRPSPVYGFTKREGAPWELFAHYLACEPIDGPIVEFVDDEEKEQESSGFPQSSLTRYPAALGLSNAGQRNLPPGSDLGSSGSDVGKYSDDK